MESSEEKYFRSKRERIREKRNKELDDYYDGTTSY